MNFLMLFLHFSSPLFILHITDSFPLGRMARSKFVESFNLAQNECSVDDPEVLAPNGYGIDN